MSTSLWTIACCQMIVLSCAGLIYTAKSETTWTISPTRSIESGGIKLIVYGDFTNFTNHESQNRSYCLIFTSSNHISEKSDKCDVNNATQMTCRTPSVKVAMPSTTVSTTSVSMSDTSDNTTSKSDNTSSISSPLSSSKPIESFSAYVMTSNGEKYPINSSISVYRDPMFKQQNQTFIQDQGNSITIESDSELLGFTADDVTIRIGSDSSKSAGSCSDVVINNSTITCKPSSIDPQLIKTGSELQYTLPVEVTVGGAPSQEVGYLVYGLNTPFSIIIIVMAVILGIIIIISLIIGLMTVCGCSCCSRTSEPDQQRLTPEESDYSTLTTRRADETEYGKINTKSSGSKLSRTGYSWSPEDSKVDTMQIGRITRRID